MSESTEKTEAPTTEIKPGKRLKEARTGRRLTLEQVADDLCLTARQVEALENDDYDYLPGRTYVRGYVRNYARLLGIPSEDVLGPEMDASPEPGIHKFTTGKAVRAQEAHNRRSVLILSIAILAIVIGLLISWWQGRETPQLQTISEGDSQSAETATLETEEDMRFSMPEPVSPQVEAPTVNESETQDIPGSTPEPDEVDSETTTTEVENVSEVEETTSTEQSAADAAASSEPLVIKYNADSWSDIRDANDKRLVYRTVAAGETLELNGKPPFKLFFGFAKGVDVTYKGEKYDLSPHVRGVFARFTLN